MAGYREEKGELRLDGLDGGYGERRGRWFSGRHWWLGEGRRKRR